eukprot:3159852-Rhodomonas_salina.1
MMIMMRFLVLASRGHSVHVKRIKDTENLTIESSEIIRRDDAKPPAPLQRDLPRVTPSRNLKSESPGLLTRHGASATVRPVTVSKATLPRPVSHTNLNR